MALTRKIVLDATAAEVWDKVATGQGLSSWFVPHELEPRKGGFGRADFGGGTYAEGRVLEYDPGKRIALGSERIAQEVGGEPKAEGGSRLEFWIGDGGEEPEDIGGAEYRGIGDVRGRSRTPGGPRTVLYLRQEGFPDVDQEVYEDGWDVYLYTLTESLKHFRGATAVATTSLVVVPRDRKDAYDTAVTGGLGVDRDAAEGDALSLKPRGRDQIDGVVDLRRSTDSMEAFGLRNGGEFVRVTAVPMAGNMTGVAFHRYQYVDDPPSDLAGVRGDRAGQWQRWLEEQYA